MQAVGHKVSIGMGKAKVAIAKRLDVGMGAVMNYIRVTADALLVHNCIRFRFSVRWDGFHQRATHHARVQGTPAPMLHSRFILTESFSTFVGQRRDGTCWQDLLLYY